MLYHPDKHRDIELKSQAEQLFNQVRQAYEGKDASAMHKHDTWKVHIYADWVVIAFFPSAKWWTLQSHIWHIWEERAGSGGLGGIYSV